MYLAGIKDFYTWSSFVVFPQNLKRHKGKSMTHDFSVCPGLKRKHEKCNEEQHGVQAQTEVTVSWRTHKNQVLTVPPPISLVGEWMT
jgi:hypothetical protein